MSTEDKGLSSLFDTPTAENIAFSFVLGADLRLLRAVLESWDQRRHCFARLLELRGHPALGVFFSVLETNVNPIPYRSLFRILDEDRHNANLLLIERPYLEMEFWDTYADFHSRSFFSHPKQCFRVHFFNTKLASPEPLARALLAGLTQNEIQEQGYWYRGFMTVRPPVPSFNLGRTGVPFDPRPGQERGVLVDPLESRLPPYCKGNSKQIANLCATQLSIDGVPFLQQDPVVGMCATASLWVASQVLAARFDLHKFPYIQITRQAEQMAGLASPRDVPDNQHFARGLTVPEICAAVRRTGAVPLVIDQRVSKDRRHASPHMRDMLYTFVESELPVILCCQKPRSRPGHAITTVGHTAATHRQGASLASLAVATAYPKGSVRQILVSQAVKRFHVHDDAYGPYSRLDFVEPSAKLLKQGFLCPVDLARDKMRRFDLRWMIVPMPPYVKNRPDFIMKDACKRYADVFYKKVNADDDVVILWRSLLIKGSRFKRSLVDRKFHPSIIEAYARLHLPKYVWLLEISQCFRDAARGMIEAGRNRLVVGEFLYDTTTPHYSTRVIVQRVGPYFVTHPKPHSLSREEQAELLVRERLPGVSPTVTNPCFSGPPQD